MIVKRHDSVTWSKHYIWAKIKTKDDWNKPIPNAEAPIIREIWKNHGPQSRKVEKEAEGIHKY